MSQNQLPFQFVPAGQVTSFSGAGVSASFTSRKDEIQAQLDELTLRQSLQGIQFANSSTNGPNQQPFPFCK